MTELYNIVRDRYDYDEKTGWLTWKNHPQHKFYNEKRVGGLYKSSNYRRIGINGKLYLEHRIIWLWKYGYLPENEIDHRNRIKDDNKISNLREITPSCNMKNIGLKSNNKTGIVGVSITKDGKFLAYITNKMKKIHLGTFNILLEAVKARYLGEIKYKYENCNSTSTAYQYIKDNDPEWFNYEMKVEKSNCNESSGIKGVYFHKQSNKWVSEIRVNKKRIRLGSFENLTDAVMARYKVEVKYNRTKNSQVYDYLIERGII